LLVKLNFDVVSVRAAHTRRERDEACKTFNDPTSTCQVFVTSLQVAGHGLDLHHSCSEGMILQYPGSAPVSSRHSVDSSDLALYSVSFQIVKMRKTFAEWVEFCMCKKHSPQLLAEGGIPERFRDTSLRTIMRGRL
jgi:hypothetical protein